MLLLNAVLKCTVHLIETSKSASSKILNAAVMKNVFDFDSMILRLHILNYYICRSENHPYECPDCGTRYKLWDSLRKHLRKTHNENGEVTNCRFCDKIFKNGSQKREHIASMHSG